VGLLLAASLGLATSACHRSGHSHPHGQSGGVDVYSFVEAEPNNGSHQANYLGSLAVGEALVVRGHVDDSGFDPFDGFAFTTVQPLDVEVYLTSDDPWSDLDLCYFDPYLGVEAACWETSNNPEAGVLLLSGGEDAHLVVSSWVGASTYTLEIVARPVGTYGPAAAPAPTEGQRRERAVPFSQYGAAEIALGTEGLEQPAVTARERLIALDPRTGETLVVELEHHARRTEGEPGG
jgi:hypothetical protein